MIILDRIGTWNIQRDPTWSHRLYKRSMAFNLTSSQGSCQKDAKFRPQTEVDSRPSSWYVSFYTLNSDFVFLLSTANPYEDF